MKLILLIISAWGFWTSSSQANMASCPLLIADTVNIYSPEDVSEAHLKADIYENKSLKVLYEDMLVRGGKRYIIKPSNIGALDGVYKHSPNFSNVIDSLKASLAMAIKTRDAVQFTPILLTGDPGVGKTHFANSLASALGISYQYVPMGSTTAGWILSGADPGWKGSKPGKLADQLIHGNDANPLVVLDEIDKAGKDKQYDPLGALYGLLERDTARIFSDEYVKVTTDASHVLWIATANDASLIPDAILDRMDVYEIKLPNADGSRIIAQNIFDALLKEHPNLVFTQTLPEAILEELKRVYPRNMKKLLSKALDKAALENRDHLMVSDLDFSRVPTDKMPIGFR